MDGDFSVPAAVLAAYGLDEAHTELLAGGRTNRTLRVHSSRVRPRPGAPLPPHGGHDLVLQQMLGSAHGDLLGIMENLVRVTAHLDWQRSVERLGDSWYPVLVPAATGKPFMMTDEGDVWRAFSYREGQILRAAQPLAQLSSAAALYGRFTAATSDLGGPALIATAPGFHDLHRVQESLMRDVEAAAAAQRAELADDLAQITRIAATMDQRCRADGVLWSADRVVHNDTKLSNVLFDPEGQTAIAVLDLDLVMMGPSWHDVGDLIRSACWHAPAATDAPVFTHELFEAIVTAFVQAGGETLTNDEIVTYALAGPRLSFELGMRYLNDHLRPEPRLAVAGENGHLIRGRANLKLAEEMLNAYDALRLVVDSHVDRR